MRRAANKNERGTADADPVRRAELLRGTISAISLGATEFLPKAKIESTARHWLTGLPPPRDEAEVLRLFGTAFLLATAVVLFAPSASGQTAVDRFACQRKPVGPDDAMAIEALRHSRFRLLRIEESFPTSGFTCRDLTTGETLRWLDDDISPVCVGLSVAVRVCPIEADLVVAAGPVLPLDDAMLDLARSFIRPNGRGLAEQRCAEALYRHAVRQGVPLLSGLGGSSPEAPDDFPFLPEDGPLHLLAFEMETADGDLSPEETQSVREMSGEDNLVEVIIGLAAARMVGREALASAYQTLALIQMETVERRRVTGLSGSLDAVAALLDQAIADEEAPSSACDLFRDLRRRVKVAPSRATASTDELDKVLGRIQGLREKTVDKGCTEQEALAAAEKVADLLDRYGLSLSEVELKGQSCEGAGIETGRKRSGPIDVCVPAVGRFCDCRVWRETGPTGEIRYVFFGLPADVAGARYLYDLVRQAFETETERFKAGALYAQHHTSERRSATTSFQTGLAHGIAAKLTALHEERGTSMRASTGRDLVPIKAAVVDEELARLGMTFEKRSVGRGKRVLSAAYHAGHEAADRFEYRPGIE